MGLAVPVLFLGSLWLGVELGAGVPRSRFVEVLRLCWPLLMLVVLWQLSRFASSTNDQGGDMTDQTVLELLAVAYVALYGLATLGGRIYRLAAGPRVVLEPAPSLAVASAPSARSGSPVWKAIGLGTVALLLALAVWGAVKVVEKVRYDNRPYPHALPTSGSDDLSGTDYGPSIAGAAAAVGVPLLWFGSRAFGRSLRDVSLTERHGPSFPPSATIGYDENGAIQIWQRLTSYDGQEDQFLRGASITVHGATFYFSSGFRQGVAIGLVKGREVTVDAPVTTRVEWTRALRSLRWACPPARADCSGW